MKDYFGQHVLAKGTTFTLATAEVYHALNSFHSHPEVELLYVESGEGTFSIGNTSRRISSGTMILIAGNVPHLFKFESNRYYDYAMKHGKTPKPLKLLSLHIDMAQLGATFLALPENEIIHNLLAAAKNGMLINEVVKPKIVNFFSQMETVAPYEQIPLLIQMIGQIATSEQHVQDSNAIVQTGDKPFKRSDETRLTMIYLYTMDNFYKDIKLKDIANIVHMVPNAFCHYFKSRTGRSYFDFLISIRIEHACKLLRESDDSVAAICTDAGFSNLSNFNRYFKLQTGKSPLVYRKENKVN